MAREPEGADGAALPPSLRFLKGLVIVLTLVMIGGVIAIVALLVTRLPGALDTAAPPPLPAAVALPAGARPQAVTFGRGWVGVVVEQPGEPPRFLAFAPDGREIGRLDLPAGP